MKKHTLVVVAVAVALGMSGCSGTSNVAASGDSVDSVTIGSIHPLSGSLSGVGGLMNAGAKMAVADINEAGGIGSLGGATLVLNEGDSQGKAEIGQSEAQRLISEGAVALIGTYQSDVTQNVASVAERAKVPLVIDVAVDDKILEQGYSYSFRIQPDATSMGASGARSLIAMGEATGTEIDTVAYIHIEGAFGGSVFEAFKTEAEATGITVADEITYSGANFSDATTQVTQALASDPDVIVVTGYFPDNLLIAEAVNALKPDIKAVFGIASGAYDDNSFPAAAGEAASNILSANYHYSATSDRAADIRTRFEAANGESMETASMLSYQAVEVIAAALEESGSVDPEVLRDAISSLSLTDPLLEFNGPIEFDENGQNINATVVVMQVQDGAVEQVFPTEIATKEAILPAFSR
ncbi:ABC transporter substrate-binding protein [Cryobacterium levicorallinum]|nr:ABC transporter substrate-binding protein [Cryobacterium levicorallinum]GEP28581.1 amino acid ABC transporter substrate-binding protein [Cryobacterium levicorallinum]SFH94396.1 branched-chain amino acid transport system substrate-binding protein [Cryobacterium levicorallinum]